MVLGEHLIDGKRHMTMLYVTTEGRKAECNANALHEGLSTYHVGSFSLCSYK